MKWRNQLFAGALCSALSFAGLQSSAQISTIAGTGAVGFGSGSFSGDGGAATAANLYDPAGIAFDRTGNLYFADNMNNRIRMVNSAGIISTVAGTGTPGYSGDGGAATAATFSYPAGITFDTSGNLYIADQGNASIRKIDVSGTITTVVGGMYGFTGDGGLAIDASLNNPDLVIFDGSGNMYIADWGNNRVRMVNTAGVITTVAGNGNDTCSGDGGPATNAGLSPGGIVFDNAGNMLIADASNARIRRVNSAGIITTIAGTGSAGYYGDGGPALSAEFLFPGNMLFDHLGNLVICDEDNQRIRRIDTSGNVWTIAGDGVPGLSGDGGPATAADLNYPESIAFDNSGNLVLSDLWNNRVRKIIYSGTLVSLSSQVVTTEMPLSVYPNPATGSLHVSGLTIGVAFTITDMAGASVIQGTLSGGNNIINLQALEPGTYVLSLNDNGRVIYTGKVLKQS